MKNITKKITSITTAAAAAAAFGVIANAQSPDDIYINGKLADNTQIKAVDSKKFIPLRAVCEQLGLNVEWQNDTRSVVVSAMPVYITLSIDKDGYTFAKTAPIMLGEAPRLINDSTYVPLAFINEILQGTFEETENGIYISYGEEQQSNTVSGQICEMIYKDDKLVQIAIGDKDDINSQTLLNLTEEMAAKAVELGLKEGSFIEAEITDIQTMSIPPQVIPTSITAADSAENTVEITGTVCELVYDESNVLSQIIIGSKDDPATQTAFNIADELIDTVKELDIKEGTTIVVTADPEQTKSIPPQQLIHSIDIVNAVEVNGTVCELIYDEDNKLVQIAVGDKEDPMSQVVFNLTDELAAKAKELKIEEGTKIKGTAKNMQTMSIPPQQPLLTLELDD